MQKTIWLFGGIAGVLSAVLEYVFYSGQNFNTQSLYLLKIAILAICVVFALILLRKLKGGIISIGRTILSGVLISVVKSVISIVVFLFLFYPKGEFYEKHKEQAKIEAVKIITDNSELEEAEKPAKITEAHGYIEGQFKPLGYSVSTIIEGLVTSFVVSILMAAFISTNMMYHQE